MLIRIQKISIYLINILSVGIFCFIFYVVVFDTFDQFRTSLFDGMYRHQYLVFDMIPNILIIMVVLLVGIGMRILFRNRKDGKITYKKWLIKAAMVLFVIQGFIVVHIYHYGWTDVVIINEAAYNYANGVKKDFFYSWAPNQIYCYAAYVLAYKAADFSESETAIFS